MGAGEFLYAFVLMFLAIFGLAMLIKALAWALLRQRGGRFEVYIKSDADAEDFVEYARQMGHIKQVNIMLTGGECDDNARLLAQKYALVRLCRIKQEK